MINSFHIFSRFSGLIPNLSKCEIAGIGLLKGVKEGGFISENIEFEFRKSQLILYLLFFSYCLFFFCFFVFLFFVFILVD